MRFESTVHELSLNDYVLLYSLLCTVCAYVVYEFYLFIKDKVKQRG